MPDPMPGEPLHSHSKEAFLARVAAYRERFMSDRALPPHVREAMTGMVHLVEDVGMQAHDNRHERRTQIATVQLDVSHMRRRLLGADDPQNFPDDRGILGHLDNRIDDIAASMQSLVGWIKWGIGITVGLLTALSGVALVLVTIVLRK